MVPGSKILLTSPKYPANLAAVVRAAACWGINHVIWSGSRTLLELDRLPRELRMKAYASIFVEASERPFDIAVRDKVVPVCVEVGQGVPLQDFTHPPNAMYVFGPEDGSVPHTYKRHCHQFVTIPSAHCLNLAAAVNVVLFHRFISLKG